MNIVLLGYRGCGKSTLGKKLAEETWKDFIDTDQLVRARFGNKTIAEIWQQFGEAEFRRVETEVAREVMGRKDAVIALGGGTVMQSAAREAVKAGKDAVRVYLYCAAEELAKRIAADQATQADRPNLTNLGGGVAEVQAVLAQRDPVYREVADKVFDVTLLDRDSALRYFIKYCL